MPKIKINDDNKWEKPCMCPNCGEDIVIRIPPEMVLKLEPVRFNRCADDCPKCGKILYFNISIEIEEPEE